MFGFTMIKDYLNEILDGSKTFDARSYPTNKRGKFALIDSNYDSLYDTQINQNYQDVGLDYIKQPLEMQAYAFQTAITMLYEEVYAKFELEGVDAHTLDKINDLAEDYYLKYKEKFDEVVCTQ